MLKIAVVAPMPSDSVSTATAVKPGVRRNARSAWRRSWAMVSRSMRAEERTGCQLTVPAQVARSEGVALDVSAQRWAHAVRLRNAVSRFRTSPGTAAPIVVAQTSDMREFVKLAQQKSA